MRRLLMIAVVFALAASAGAEIAVYPTNRLSTKPPADIFPNIPNPDRQGGDTIADATAIPAIPYYITGTTTGFNDDYDEACPYTGSTSPEVVYAYTPPEDLVLNFDLFGSSYDTKVYVYDESLTLVACNDDYYPDYVSKLEKVALLRGVAYFIVIDGYGGDHGEYVLNIVEYVRPELCVLYGPGDYCFAEGEPPLVDGYLDAFNGGCNSPQFGEPFQELYGDEQGNLVFCGVAGWYLFDGSTHRDTDWFHLYMGPAGVIEVTAAAERPTYFTETHQWCGMGPVIEHIYSEDCQEDSGTIMGYAPGGLIWFIILSATFEPPWAGFGHEYDYVVWFSGLMPAPVATETASWSAVKALFR